MFIQWKYAHHKNFRAVKFPDALKLFTMKNHSDVIVEFPLVKIEFLLVFSENRILFIEICDNLASNKME